MTGPRVQTCLHCDGARGGRCEDSGAWAPCEGCAGSGLLVDCMQCSEPMPYGEAAREGAYCGGCRAELDASDRDYHERAMRRTG